MLITVPIQGSLSTGKESCFCIALWVEFSQKESVIRTVGQKGNIVFLGHGMLDGEKEFVLYVFHTKHMRLIRGSASRVGSVTPQQEMVAAPLPCRIFPQTGQA